MNFNFFDTIGQSLFGGGSSSGEYPGIFGNPTEAWDQFKNGQTNVVNKEIAEQNLQFQRENLDYQKALQERIFDREDTSYQRTVNDMRQAGLNPLTMNGKNGSGEAIATTPLHNDFQMQDQGIGTVISDLIGTLNGIQNYQIGTSYGKEQEAKATSAQAQAYIDLATAIDKIDNSHIENDQKKKILEDFTRNMQFNEDFNIFNGMDNNARDTRIMQALSSGNDKKMDFATKYKMNQMEINGLKVGSIADMLLELSGESLAPNEKTPKNKEEIKEEAKQELSGSQMPNYFSPKTWQKIGNYYKKNWEEYGWKTWLWKDN